MDPSFDQKKPKRVMHPNSLANLRPVMWKPGQSGNPQGVTLTARLRKMMEKPLTPPPPDAPAAEVFVYNTIQKGIEGQPALNKEVWERHDGKMTQPISGEDGQPIKILIEGVSIGDSGPGKPFKESPQT